MSQVTQNQNLNAHYSANTKVKRPANIVANAPSTLPNNKMPYYDSEATKRMQSINESIYNDYKAEKQKVPRVYGQISYHDNICFHSFVHKIRYSGKPCKKR